ncbi:MAG TPA: hypothetical protein VF787_04545 [Thermoanaerobaculia bacterium]
MRQTFRTLVITLTAALLTLLLVRLLHARGGPYWEIPETILDHVEPEQTLSRQAIVMSRRAEPLMHAGASLTVIAPAQAPNYDFTHHLVACGMLPHHEVRHPSLGPGEQWPDFVIALGAPLEHPGYMLLREFPEGRLYMRR